MKRRWNAAAKRAVVVTAICALSGAVGVGLLPSRGSATLGCNGSGTTPCEESPPTNPGANAVNPQGSAPSNGGGTSSSTSSTKIARFYDAAANGADPCTGVGSTLGRRFGTARAKVGTPSTVSIRVSRLSPGTTYSVVFDDGSCFATTIGTLVTDSHGRGKGTYTFSATPYTGPANFLLFNTPADQFQTTEITF